MKRIFKRMKAYIRKLFGMASSREMVNAKNQFRAGIEKVKKAIDLEPNHKTNGKTAKHPKASH